MKTKIEWADYTFNPWIGCAKIDQGCAHCYAETLETRRGWTPDGWGKGKPRRRTSVQNWNAVLKWNAAASSFRECTRCGRRDHMADGCTLCGCDIVPARPRVFCASLADWLDDEVPAEWLRDLLDLIRLTPNLDWLLLTKRPENFFPRLLKVSDLCEGDPKVWGGGPSGNMPLFHWIENHWDDDEQPANIWLGTSVSDQDSADKRIPLLLNIPARVRFLSCEPMLEIVNLGEFLAEIMPVSKQIVSMHYRPDGSFDPDGKQPRRTLQLKPDPGLHWVICGGESGPSARPMHPDWARALRDQCQGAGIPFFFKQWGEWVPQYSPCIPDGRSFEYHRATDMVRVGKLRAGRLLDGALHDAFPTLRSLGSPSV